MNTIFANEKLGMPVEELRLREIRQQIEMQRFAQEARNAWFKRMGRRLIIPVVSLLNLFAH